MKYSYTDPKHKQGLFKSAKKQGKSLGAVEEDLGYGRNTLYKIKNSTLSTDQSEV